MGKLIVIDGLDGSGKRTQAEILRHKLSEMGKNVHLASFPDYESDSSAAIKMYLNGELGTDPFKLDPYACSLFYTVDRVIQFIKELNDIYNQEDSIIICDRYISANIIHQGAKLETVKEKKDYFDWLYNLEVNNAKLPHDDITIILSLPVATSQKLMSKRYDNNESKKDIHEVNIPYLNKCYECVEVAVKHLSETGHNWMKIDSSDDNGDIKSLDEIAGDIWKVVKDII